MEQNQTTDALNRDLYQGVDERYHRLSESISKLDLVIGIIAPCDDEEGRKFQPPLSDEMRFGVEVVLNEVKSVLKGNLDHYCCRCDERK